MAKKIPNVVARNRIQTPLANALENQQILEQEQILANIIILEDLRDLIPPLQEEEYNRLEQNILTDDEGIREPIKLWKTRILDQTDSNANPLVPEQTKHMRFLLAAFLSRGLFAALFANSILACSFCRPP